MIFIKETGAILGQSRQILHVVEGNAGMVVFPTDVIYKIHKITSGQIFAFSHVHPDGMTILSHEDETTLFAQSLWFYPYPCRMITITLMRSDPFTKEHAFRETCYVGLLEAKETWLLHKDQKRKFEIIREWDRDFIIEEPQKAMNDWYGLILIRKSYEFENKRVN